MKKQYIAQIKFHEAWDKKWINTCVFLDDGKRYHDTLESAKSDLSKVIKKFNNRKAGVETTYHAGFGIDTIVDQKSIDRMTIVETRIRWREVTDWKEVE